MDREVTLSYYAYNSKLFQVSDNNKAQNCINRYRGCDTQERNVISSAKGSRHNLVYMFCVVVTLLLQFTNADMNSSRNASY